MKSKILFLKHSLNEDSNQLLKSIVLYEIEIKKSSWVKTVFEFMDQLILSDILKLPKYRKYNKKSLLL